MLLVMLKEIKYLALNDRNVNTDILYINKFCMANFLFKDMKKNLAMRKNK